ncbi:hypothetical protein ACFVS2_20650 [Brevibacillus sp. NPDC058079]|uniref:hypothetical protein n=1 Tax=Brevibacillus sp. NPDC058079 TaxID=3346330 RepID=UPI0036ED2E3A
MGILAQSEMKVAFEMRLNDMDPMKHVKLSYDMVPNTAFNVDVIVKWRRIIKELVQKEKNYIENESIPYGLYPMIAGFPTGYFTYLFDPSKYQHFIDENNIQTIKIPTLQLIKYVDQQQLDPIHRFEDNDKDAPIIILESPLFNQPFCISGNLKITDAYKGVKRNLSVYYLLTDEYLHLMHDDLSKAMHMFHSDLQVLSQSGLPPKFEELYISKTINYLFK